MVCLAAGFETAALAPGLSLRPVRGQVSVTEGPVRPQAAAWGGYVIPTREGLLFGATHDRGETSDEVRAADHARNLGLLAQRRPALAASLAGAALGGRAGVRAAAPDHLPLAGALGEAGLYVLSGLGGRGLCLAPLLAEHVAALALGVPSPLPRALAAVAAPARFSNGSAGS
ncbi:MAG: FAD-dependent oxidoreductase [Caulobacteraceae bacterium]